MYTGYAGLGQPSRGGALASVLRRTGAAQRRLMPYAQEADSEAHQRHSDAEGQRRDLRGRRPRVRSARPVDVPRAGCRTDSTSAPGTPLPRPGPPSPVLRPPLRRGPRAYGPSCGRARRRGMPSGEAVGEERVADGPTGTRGRPGSDGVWLLGRALQVTACPAVAAPLPPACPRAMWSRWACSLERGRGRRTPRRTRETRPAAAARRPRSRTECGALRSPGDPLPCRAVVMVDSASHSGLYTASRRMPSGNPPARRPPAGTPRLAPGRAERPGTRIACRAVRWIRPCG